MLSFWVPGLPRTAGSKRAVHVGGRTILTHDNPQTKPWMAMVAEAAREASDGPLLDGHIEFVMLFSIVRPQGQYGKRGLLKSAKRFPPSKPDVTKLVRAAEDALTKVLWTDDSRVALQRNGKLYHDDPLMEEAIRRAGGKPGCAGCVVWVRELDEAPDWLVAAVMAPVSHGVGSA